MHHAYALLTERKEMEELQAPLKASPRLSCIDRCIAMSPLPPTFVKFSPLVNIFMFLSLSFFHKIYCQGLPDSFQFRKKRKRMEKRTQKSNDIHGKFGWMMMWIKD